MIQYHYCILRKDLTVGQKCSQIGHAAGESYQSPSRNQKGWIRTYFIGLETSAAKLLELEQVLIKEKIEFVSIREPDMDDELVAIGVQPGPKDKLSPILGKYQLIK